MPYEYHKFSEIFPLMDGVPFDELVADIQANGQQLPILLYQGQILDGRNRDRACTKLGIKPVVENAPVRDDQMAVALMVSLNKNRRHMSEDQLAFVGARLANLKWGSNRFESKVEVSAETSTNTVRASRTVREAATMVGVPPIRIKRARAVLANAPAREKNILDKKESLSAVAAEVAPRRGAKGKSTSRQAAAQAVRERGRALTKQISKPRGLTMEEVDPELAKNPMAFATKYGFVLSKTKDQLEFDAEVKRADALMVWMGEKPDASIEDLFSWISYAKNAKEVDYKRGKLRDRLAGVLADLRALDRRLVTPMVAEAAE